MRRVAGLAGVVLLLLLAWLGARADVVQKGDPRAVDVTLNEGFESESWRIGWTTVDADGSGDSWGRLGTAQYYEPHSGEWALGSRFRADGEANDDWLITPPMLPDSSRRFFKIWYRSQDPSWPETVEFYSLRVDAVLSPGEVATRLADFQRISWPSEAPASWQEFSHELATDAGGVWYFAVRNVSRDRFVLLVDDATGFPTRPPARWWLESAYQRFDFGLTPSDTMRILPLRFWNLDAGDTLQVVFEHKPDLPFQARTVQRAGASNVDWATADTVYLWKADPDSSGSQDSLHINFGVQSFYEDEATGDTIRFSGTYADSLCLSVAHFDSYQEAQQLTVPFTVSFWSAATQDRLDLFEDFQDDALLWSRSTAANDTVSWELGEHSSAPNFTVPLHGRFAYVNSDARGRFLGEEPLVQDAWLVSPWLDASRTLDGAPAQGLLLAWDQYLNSQAGGGLEILADSAGTGWRVVGRPTDSDSWEDRSLDLSALAGTDSLRLAFRYQGSWSYGAALDNLVLLSVTDSLPGSTPPPSPPRQDLDEVTLAPNPFNPLTMIRWQAVAAGRLEVRVYNILGQQVLSRGPWLLRPGANAFPLDFSRMASGVYLVRMISTGADGRATQQLRRVTLLK